MDASELIDELGGSAVVAARLGVGLFTVGNWRKRGVPAWAIPAMQNLCRERGINPGKALEPRQPRPSKDRTAREGAAA